jgi:diaminopimelate decarboxylase
VLPLTARLEGWQRALAREPGRLAGVLAGYGSPVNVLNPGPLGRNAAELSAAARRCGLELRIKFARKANRALCFVDEARRLGLGVDVASERELGQTLDRGVPAADIIVTAAVKPEGLLRLCVASGATTAIDNADELGLLGAVAGEGGGRHPVAMRLAVAGPRETRFGMPASEIVAAARRIPPRDGPLRIAGIHFHLDGYRAAERVEGIAQALAVVEALRALGHRPSFIDIGGGVPMSYLDDAGQWEAFWRAHEAALLGRRAPLTFQGHPLGLAVRGGRVVGRPNVYPAFQRPVRGDWLRSVLAAPLPGGRDGVSVAGALRRAAVNLHCEPGRALLDGCGLTVARVEFRKRRRAGGWFIGLAMNRTQVRSAADDFLVDPLLVPAPGVARAGQPVEGHLVGAYCIERELLTWRRLVFPDGVEVGDMVVFPNTAGYMMHILESPSHQIPLAANLVIDGAGDVSPDPGG